MSRSPITIYHNPRCQKSRQTLQLIRDAGIEPEIVEYLKNPPSADGIDRLAGLLGVEPARLVRTKETLFRELNVDLDSLSREQVVRLLAEHPRLLERPIVVKGRQAVIGRPPENVQPLL